MVRVEKNTKGKINYQSNDLPLLDSKREKYQRNKEAWKKRISTYYEANKKIISYKKKVWYYKNQDRIRKKWQYKKNTMLKYLMKLKPL